MRVTGDEWNSEQVDELRRLWAAGNSSGTIAAQLGKTRSAIAGKISRLDLPTPFGKKPRAQIVRRDKPAPQPVNGYVPTHRMSAAHKPQHVVQLPPTAAWMFKDGCRWPEGDVGDPDFHFCKQPISKGAYCKQHAARAYRSC